MTSEEDLDAHCRRPYYEVHVRSEADAIVLAVADELVARLCEMSLAASHKQEGAGIDYFRGAHDAYEAAARLLDERFQAALSRYGEVTRIRMVEESQANSQ